MLLTKSFDISDSEGVNKLLKEYRIAGGAHILVSDGKVLIPYEDGAEPTTAQRIVEIREDQNKLRAEMRIIEHSNRVLRHLIADAEDRVNVAKAAVEKATANPVKKEAEAKLKEAQNALDQLLNQMTMNTHEINRQQVNIDEYDIEIAGLGK